MENETVYLKIKISKENQDIERIREAGLFFELIAETLNIKRENISEIDLSEENKNKSSL